MADAHGGYRTPAHPAPQGSSGPGKFSKRTDTGPKQSISTAPGQDYGDAKQQAADQRTAPMAAANPLPNAPSGGTDAEAAMHQMPQFQGSINGPSQRPGEPVTHGVDIGGGAGSEAMTLPQQQSGTGAGTGAMTQLFRNLSSTDTTGVLAALYDKANQLGV